MAKIFSVCSLSLERKGVIFENGNLIMQAGNRNSAVRRISAFKKMRMVPCVHPLCQSARYPEERKKKNGEKKLPPSAQRMFLHPFGKKEWM